MAGNAVIGALRVDLGINSAQFSAGLKSAQSSLAGFGKAAAAGLAAAAVSAAALTAALGVAVKGAIDHADALSKTAQKAGVTTEALSRLDWAAKLSDVSLEQLSTGLIRLSKNMADIATGSSGPAATAFEALGIAVTDASGQLRDSDVVFAEIADRFARMEDGATKTALATQIFGKAGAELIPMLNSGKDGLKAMADESDRLGLTIGTKTGKAAETFNDTLTRISAILQGLTNKVMEAALPALQGLADTLASPEFAQAAQTLATNILGALDRIIEGIVAVINHFDAMARAAAMDEAKQRLADRLSGRSAGTPGARTTKVSTVYEGMLGEDGQINLLTPPPVPLPRNALPMGDINFGTIGGGAAATGDAMATRLEALRQALMTEEQLEADSHAKRLAEIASFYEAGMIARGEYDSLLEAAQQQHADRMNEIAKRQVEEEARIREQLVGNVASIFGSLSTLAEQFGDKGLVAAKGFAVAEAVINTAQGITKALAQGGMLGFAGAAAVAAAGAAQIATILNASKGSASTPSVTGTGGGVTTPAASAEGGGTQSILLELHGNKDTPTTMGAVKSLFEQLQDELGVQGKQIIVAYKGA